MSLVQLALLAADENQEQDVHDLLARMGDGPDSSFAISRAVGGKPLLQVSASGHFGFSRSHARDSGLTLLGLVRGHDIGVDIEHWPQGGCNLAFLESVASPEDAKAVAKLGATGRDVGVALWVIKEAALKCTGEVMTDPRDLAVHRQKNGVYRVRSANRASAPHPEIDVRLFTTETMNTVFLIGVALGANSDYFGNRFSNRNTALLVNITEM